MTYLEPRIEKAGSVLFEELDEINEVIFIMMGTIEIGFEINKTRKFSNKKARLDSRDFKKLKC